ncbi:glycosyltransferase family 2 protein [Palleronia sp.]|uniref:glycosyltransferase family 2 protein n=1 Tax=Palleronia sp. TaxID=1940284 RepID=UPI0035C81BFF
MSMRVLGVSSLRDEGPNLLHWLAHHKAAGIGDWLLYTNDCADGTDRLLDLLAAAGEVVHVPNEVPRGQAPQWSALKAAAAHPMMSDADWVLVFDCDEYVNLRASLASVQDLIAHSGADAIVLPWRLFGHAGHATRPDVAPTKAFTRAIPEDALYPALARFFKTLYRREAFRAPGVHRPKPRGSVLPKWVDGSGTRLPDSFAEGGQIMVWGAPLANGLVQLNHYSVRSAEEFVAKRARGLPNHTDKAVDLNYWVERNFNSVEDRSVSWMAERTAVELARLRALPGVAKVEAESLAWHRRAFQDALMEADTVKLYGRLLLAAGSHAPDARTAQVLVRLNARSKH